MTEAISYPFDVFLSYSHRDNEWVRGELLPKLEANGLQVCIDFRDFEPGAPTIKEIERAVTQSRKTLLVLTQAYLKGDWTGLESFLVQTDDPTNRNRRLIPLRKDACEIPKSINVLTYVDFGNADYLDIEWKKLLKALGGRPAEVSVRAPQSAAPGHIDTATTTRSARQGLDALLELVRDPAVQANVATFRAVFDASGKQIEVLGYYKDLHDLLHTLQFKCYNYLATILRNAQTSPGDACVWNDVLEYELTLQDLVSVLNRLTAQAQLAQRTGPWIQRLRTDLNAVFAAIKNCDAPRLAAALRPLKRLLATEPTLINTRLTEAARALPLVKLKDALARVYDNLDRGNVIEDTVSKFKNGVDALENLSITLTSLIDDHDRWQRIDDELRRVEASLVLDPSDLPASWPELKEMTDAQCRDVPDEWALRLAEDSRKLDEAIAAQDPNKLKQGFGRYRSRIGNRFYQVDLALKSLCDQLRRIGEPLASLLEIL